MSTTSEATPVIDDALSCPLCGYDLRGLPTHRCPECGHAFDPDELRRDRDDRTRWRFEEAPRRLARAFARTSLATLRPFRFWADLRAADRIVPRRLVLWTYGCLGTAAAVFLVPFAISVAWTYYQMQQLAAARFRFVRPVNVDTSVFGAIERTAGWAGLPSSLWMIFAILLWPLMAVLASQAFGVTLRRARIHRGHLWRCVLYAWPMMAAPCVALLVVRCFVYDYEGLFKPLVEAMPELSWQVASIWGMSPISLLATAAAALLSTVHLIAAHVRYLRLPQAAAQAVLVQALAWMLIASIVHTVSML